MTIQLVTVNAHGRSKASLMAALNTKPAEVVFYEPSVVNEHHFTGDKIPPGQVFPCVLDHPKRRRFAKVLRDTKGVFHVL